MEPYDYRAIFRKIERKEKSGWRVQLYNCTILHLSPSILLAVAKGLFAKPQILLLGSIRVACAALLFPQKISNQLIVSLCAPKSLLHSSTPDCIESRMVADWQMWLSPRPKTRTNTSKATTITTSGGMALFEFLKDDNGRWVVRETHYMDNPRVRAGLSGPPL